MEPTPAYLSREENELIEEALNDGYLYDFGPELEEGDYYSLENISDDDDAIEETDFSDFQFHDIIPNSRKDRHRRGLKLGVIPYCLAWTEGFFFESGKIPYKKGSRLRKAFEAGRRCSIKD